MYQSWIKLWPQDSESDPGWDPQRLTFFHQLAEKCHFQLSLFKSIFQTKHLVSVKAQAHTNGTKLEAKAEMCNRPHMFWAAGGVKLATEPVGPVTHTWLSFDKEVGKECGRAPSASSQILSAQHNAAASSFCLKCVMRGRYHFWRLRLLQSREYQRPKASSAAEHNYSVCKEKNCSI